MKLKLNLIFSTATFLLLGVLLIVIPFLTSSELNSYYADSAKIVLFSILGVLSIVFGVFNIILFKNKQNFNSLVYLFGLIAVSGSVEGIWNVILGKTIEGVLAIITTIFIFVLILFLSSLKKKNRFTLLDGYLDKYISFAGFLIVIIYLFSTFVSGNYSLNLRWLAILLIVLTALFGAAFLIYLIIENTIKLSFSVKALRESSILIACILLGFFLSTFAFYFNPTDIRNLVIKYVLLVVGIISVVLSFVPYYLIKSKKDFKVENVYVASTSVFGLVLSIGFMFFFGGFYGQSIGILIIALIPILILIGTNLLKDLTDISPWVYIISSFAQFVFLIGFVVIQLIAISINAYDFTEIPYFAVFTGAFSIVPVILNFATITAKYFNGSSEA